MYSFSCVWLLRLQRNDGKGHYAYTRAICRQLRLEPVVPGCIRTSFIESNRLSNQKWKESCAFSAQYREYIFYLAVASTKKKRKVFNFKIKMCDTEITR